MSMWRRWTRSAQLISSEFENVDTHCAIVGKRSLAGLGVEGGVYLKDKVRLTRSLRYQYSAWCWAGHAVEDHVRSKCTKSIRRGVVSFVVACREAQFEACSPPKSGSEYDYPRPRTFYRIDLAAQMRSVWRRQSGSFIIARECLTPGGDQGELGKGSQKGDCETWRTD